MKVDKRDFFVWVAYLTALALILGFAWVFLR